MRNNWRLTTDLLALFFDGQSTKTGEIFQNVVAFCPIEKKVFKNSLIKLMGGISFKELNLSNNNFRIRVNSTGNIEISSDQFPDPTKYYAICNHNISEERLPKEVGYLISNLTNDKGYFDKYSFEIAFSGGDNLSIKLICKELDIYNKCLNELNRRTKCELFKKTKTFIPGHRYDSIEESIIYLGKFKTSRLIHKDDIFLTNDVLDYEDVHLFINADELSENEKSIKDIFNNRYFSNTDIKGIKEYRKLKPMIDSGEILINDIDSSFDLKDCRLKLINNLINVIIDSKVSVPISDDGDIIELIIYKPEKKVITKDILLPLTYFSENKYEKAEDNIKDIVKDYITNIIRLSIFKEINSRIVSSTSNDKLISQKIDINDDSIVKNSKNLLTYEFLTTEWENDLKNYLSIYLDYNNEEDILDKKIKDEIINCNNIINNFSSIDFKDYCKIISKILHRNYYSRQRENTVTYYKLDIITIESLFGKSEFTEVLKDICKLAIDKSGENVDSFIIKNVGTRKSPSYYISMCITLDDIIKYFNGIENIPSDVISTVKFFKFNSLNIDIDLDIKDIK